MTLEKATLDRFIASVFQQLDDDGLIQRADEDFVLTEKGKARIQKQIDKMTPGRLLMLEMYFAERFGVPLSYDITRKD
ncbi:MULTISPECIES: hypothetical protein [Brevibacillus]|uniref:Uncharacterized protein n=1 Tax=Brevibacillus centrosporus TaxID=54910 RepID=A0A1I3M1R1_9BACL|nr:MULTISPECIES: hypothetical protein [Brevibacillus]PSJ66947.1 hypothetical protein C7J99_22955 [Brevibacillus brevis]RED27778.1 hypothetical protein DES34_10970 [Brevibacillus brevis]TQK42144.1 hypothetical protein FB479_115136 [Brevibacillus sp. AG162]SFI90971.1 hypothetical protein SAMN05518846_101495 [Brevibacillus centrosporus]VEF86816.1 Uncharacterised protein [Brevibacillus brevis]